MGRGIGGLPCRRHRASVIPARYPGLNATLQSCPGPGQSDWTFLGPGCWMWAPWEEHDLLPGDSWSHTLQLGGMPFLDKGAGRGMSQPTTVCSGP